MPTKENGKSFALVVLSMERSFSDIPRILRIASEEHPKSEVVIVTGRGACEDVIELVKDVARDVKVILVENGSASSTVGNLVTHGHKPTHVLAERLDRYLEQHYHQESLRLRDLCTSFRISSSYVTRLFKKHVGMTFRRRLNLHRVKKAKDLLRTTDQTVDCIAKDCGFKNHTRLTEAFYRFEGMPPGQFRRSYFFLNSKLVL